MDCNCSWIRVKHLLRCAWAVCCPRSSSVWSCRSWLMSVLRLVLRFVLFALVSVWPLPSLREELLEGRHARGE